MSTTKPSHRKALHGYATAIGIAAGFAFLIGLWLGQTARAGEPLALSLGSVQIELAFDRTAGAQLTFRGTQP